MESTEIIRQDINKLMKDLDPYKAYGCDGSSLHVLKGCAETLDRLPEVLFKERSVPRESKI